MSEFINNTFNAIISDLKDQKRAFQIFEEHHYLEIKSAFDEAITNKNKELLRKVLCLCEFSSNFHKIFEEIFISGIEEETNSEFKILYLGIVLNQIIPHYQRNGEKLPKTFLDELVKLINDENLEVIEWSLRVIESTSRQSFAIKEEIIKARPGLFRRFSKHGKNINELINLIESYWPKL